MKLKCALLLILLVTALPGWGKGDKKNKHKNKHKIEDSKLLPEIETKTDDDLEDETEMSLTYQDKEKIHWSLEDMRNSFSVSLPMNRNGSGTAWNPDKAPMYKYHLYTHKWLFMFHGDVFMGFNMQDFTNAGHRGTQEFKIRDRIAFGGHRKSGLDGLFHFNAAFSTDAAMAHGIGFAQLFQTANAWNGKTIGDREHPNNILSELSASYAYSFADHGDFFVYGGYPAEPALGPVSYFKRPSGAFIPDAPLCQNWTESTSISYGVGTMGLRIGKFKLEGSTFTGRAPDKFNMNLNLPFFDSWSSRLSINPTGQWALQVSRGVIKSPDVTHPLVDVTRTTASATYVHSMGPRKYFSYTLLWGQNESNLNTVSNAALIEAILRKKKLVTYTRLEWIQKAGYELNLSPTMFSQTQQFNINALTAGGSYDLFSLKFLTLAAGAQVTAHLADASLNTLYGKYPLAGQVYLHILPILQ